jgi:hypothetical protein
MLFLSNWCRDSIRNYDPTGDTAVQTWTNAQMNERSVTRAFPVSSGDTLGFYNSHWFSRLGYSGAAYNYYKMGQSISYSVVLVDSTTGTRIAVLDSALYGTTTASRKPCIYSWYPMASRVRYVVPAGYSDTICYLQINTYASGSGAKPFVRQDHLFSFVSASQLAKPQLKAYCDSVEANIDCSSPPSCDMSASRSSSPVGISISVAGSTSLTNIKIFDIYGAERWAGVVPLTTNPTVVGLSTGLYIVVAYENGVVVCTKKIFV